MKLLTSVVTAIAMLTLAIPAQAAGVWVDGPAPNCTLIGLVNGTNAPDCEWVAVTGKSILANGGDNGNGGPNQ